MLGLFNSFIKKGERDDRNTDSIYRKERQQIERRKKNDFTISSNMTFSVPTEKKENPKQEETAIDL